ncbi:hypothetical protein A9Q87_09235 [Flavobacteriales bacterium 34_180_T64]|nr:hypothetical protein A9Q87_09235 [Flavobacteriales bacterium 34_180_T64]
MTDLSTNKPPVWFWIVSVVALIWNGLGVMAYLAQAFMTDDMMATLPETQQEQYANLPAWYTAAFATAVFLGALGCLALLLRKKWAYLLLLISFFAVLIQHVYIFMELKPVDFIMPIMIIIVSSFLVWFSKNAIAKSWIA